MISVILSTRDDAARLPRALAPLVMGVADGWVKQAIVVDGGSSDDTLEVAEAAGCDIVQSAYGAKQLIAGAAAAKARWLLFLRVETALEESWLEEARRFITHGDGRAAAFRLAYERPGFMARGAELVAFARGLVKRPRAEQGLLISRALYEKTGGYHNTPDAYANLIGRIGAQRLVMLRSKANYGEDEPFAEAVPPATRRSSGV